MDLQQPTVDLKTGGQALADLATAGSSRGGAAPWLAWSMWALSVLLSGVTFFLAYQDDPAGFQSGLLIGILDAVVLFLYATVGALVASRNSDSPIGWIFCVAALLVALGVFAEKYAQYGLITEPGSLPGGLVVAWLSAWPRNIGFFLIFTFLLLLFPNGRLPSSRWRPLAWLAAGMITIGALLDAFKPGPLSFIPTINNPLGIEGTEGIFAFFGFWDVVVLAIIVVCSVSVIVRFRRAAGQERQQLKWFAYAAVFAIVVQLGFSFIFSFVPNALPPVTGDIMLAFSIAAFAIATGIAILRYRLYDIDLLINRTLVYVPLTAILAGVYSASISLFQKLFVAVTREQSDAAIVITTLILATSFTPIKNALQSAVDRRFKEVRDPTKKLRAFDEQVRSFVQLNSAEQLTQRLLDEVVSAFDATGAALYPGQGDGLQPSRTSGEWKGDTRAEVSVPLKSDGTQLGIVSLATRHGREDYTARDQETLQEIVDVVGQAIGLASED